MVWNGVTVHCWMSLSQCEVLWHLLGVDPQAPLEPAVTLWPHSQTAWADISQDLSSHHHLDYIGRALSTSFPTSPRQTGLRNWNYDYGFLVILVSLWQERGANCWRHDFMLMLIVLIKTLIEHLSFVGPWRHRQVENTPCFLGKLRDVLKKITGNIGQFKKTSQMDDMGNNCWRWAWM